MKKLFCPNCGIVGKPKKKAQGYFFLEVLLWICFIIPGLLYSLWRLTSQKNVCGACGYDRLIPTPMAVRQLWHG